MPGESSSALSLLLGPDATGVLDAVVAEYGARLVAVRVADVHVAPTGGVRVRYVGDLELVNGAPRREILVAATGDRIPPGAAVLSGEFDGVPVEVGVWRWPQDPALPGLTAACKPTWLAGLLDGAGIAVDGALRIVVRAYRPGQRAVLEVSDSNSRWFVKVVSPQSVRDLVWRHELVGRALPVPPVVAADPHGVVVLPEARGTILRELLADQWTDGAESATLPAPSVLNELLDSLPGELVDAPARPGHLDRVEQSVKVLRLTAPCCPPMSAELLASASAVADELGAVPAVTAEPLVASHGDFHHGQLLVARGEISGVLDVDTAGPWRRADEWATLLGHLSVVGIGSRRARGYVDTVLRHADRDVDPHDLRFRCAAVVLGLATGPFRPQSPDWAHRTAERLQLARRWLDCAADPVTPLGHQWFQPAKT